MIKGVTSIIGRQHLLDYAGMDLTEEFLEIHPWVNAEFLLKSLCIGELKKESDRTDQSTRINRQTPEC